MFEFSPSYGITTAFVALTALIGLVAVLLVRAAVTRTDASETARWTVGSAIAVVAWAGAHAGIAESGILEGATMPPPVMPYLLVTIAVGFALAFSRVGDRLAALPPGLLAGVQAFRIPLEWILHELYRAGQLPVQMTWNGYNFDVITGVAAALIGVASLKWEVPRWVFWVWNVAGLLLLVNVVTIALLSAPLPLRQFTEGPPVVLVYHAPFNWIVNVHVFMALVGHLVVFRALRRDA